MSSVRASAARCSFSRAHPPGMLLPPRDPGPSRLVDRSRPSASPPEESCTVALLSADDEEDEVVLFVQPVRKGFHHSSSSSRRQDLDCNGNPPRRQDFDCNGNPPRRQDFDCNRNPPRRQDFDCNRNPPRRQGFESNRIQPIIEEDDFDLIPLNDDGTGHAYRMTSVTSTGPENDVTVVRPGQSQISTECPRAVVIATSLAGLAVTVTIILYLMAVL
ncbi:hypothetical protein ACOMHN_002458 [Nucella lapillus]